MILLALNCGLGNTDCATLPIDAFDFKTGWLNFPRPKTGIDRRCKLWPETVDALNEALNVRKRSKSRDDDSILFITSHGNRWIKNKTNSLTLRFTKLIAKYFGEKMGKELFRLATPLIQRQPV